jgi:hypothetical protein
MQKKNPHFNSLLELLKEFELMYNLGPELNKEEAAKLKKQFVNILKSN